MSIEESLGAIPITLLFDSFCIYHFFSNSWKLCQKLRTSLIFPVPVTPIFDERNVCTALSSGSDHIFMIQLSSPKKSKIVIANLADALHALQLSKIEQRVMIDSEID